MRSNERILVEELGSYQCYLSTNQDPERQQKSKLTL